MLGKALAALIGLFMVFVVSMVLASVLNLGPEEFWLIPAALVLAGAAVVVFLRRRAKSPA